MPVAIAVELLLVAQRGPLTAVLLVQRARQASASYCPSSHRCRLGLSHKAVSAVLVLDLWAWLPLLLAVAAVAVS